jgi:hypothetical protein
VASDAPQAGEAGGEEGGVGDDVAFVGDAEAGEGVGEGVVGGVLGDGRQAGEGGGRAQDEEGEEGVAGAV